jgi:hypothetical protein
MGAGKGDRDGQLIIANPKGMTVGNRLETANEAVGPALPPAIGSVTQEGLESEVVETPAKNPPPVTIHKGSQYGDKSIPEKRYGHDP